MRLLNAEDAKNLDVDLMSQHAFSIDQLMELAGLSVAAAVFKYYPQSMHEKVMVLCGSGNNGGDGLVASRHLYHFGYKNIVVVYPRVPSNDLYTRLIKQCRDLDIKIITGELHPDETKGIGLTVDAMFGFSFDASREIRAPYDGYIKTMLGLQRRETQNGGQEQQVNESDPNCAEKEKGTGTPILSVDIPSTWDVENGDTKKLGFQPDCLVSLTAPKLCARFLSPGTTHVLGGRFVPPHIAKAYNLDIPDYPGVEQIVELPPGNPEEYLSL